VDNINSVQQLAEIASPEVDQQLRQAKADLHQAEKTLDLQQANLDLARVTLGRYQAADAENVVAKTAVDQSVATARTAQAAVAAAEATVASNVANVRGRLMHPVAGRVSRTAKALDPVNRTLLVEVDIPNASHDLFPGMFVYVGFAIRPAGSRWRVPATAVVIDAEGTRVATVGAD